MKRIDPNNISDSLSDEAKKEIKNSLESLREAIAANTAQIEDIKRQNKKMADQCKALCALIGEHYHDNVRSPARREHGIDGLKEFIVEKLDKHRSICIEDLVSDAVANGFDFNGKSVRHMISATFTGMQNHSSGRYRRDGEILEINEPETSGSH